MGATSLTLTPPDTGWVYRGVCRRDPGRMDGTTPMEIEDAKRACWSCPVVTDCRAWVLSLPDSKDVSGVCAAMTAKERTRARRRVRRSRPPEPGEPPKECTGCGETKPADQFYRRPKVKSGRESRCNVCSTRQTQARRAAKRAAMAS